jgi:chemotaxis protein histidine kinase CheA
MSDTDDYTAVFFQECDELLDDLDAQLAGLEGGADDPEIVNAAFRAVHSIKGGADAFGFTELVNFAHVLGDLCADSDFLNVLREFACPPGVMCGSSVREWPSFRPGSGC